MEKVSEALKAATVLDNSGQTVSFGSLHRGQTTLIVFVRHFGCIFCRERISELTAAIDELKTLGIKSVIVGNGTPYMAEAFVQSLDLEVPLFTDPSRKTYALAGMQRNFGLGLKTVSQALRSWRSGYRQGAVAGDVWQQGGILLIDEHDHVLEAHHDEGAGDYIDLKALIARMRSRAA